MCPFANEAIEAAVQQCRAALDGCKAERSEITRVSLVLEEVLLRYQDLASDQGEFECRVRTSFGRPRIEVLVTAQSFDPFATEDDDDDFEMLNRLQRASLRSPSWSYRNGTNLVKIPVGKKAGLPMPHMLIIALLAAVACGIASLQLDDGVRQFLSNDILSPVYDTVIGIVTAVSGPLIFLSILWTIVSVGDVTTLSKIGKRTIGRFAAIMLGTGVVACAICTLVFRSPAGSDTSLNLEMLEMILDIVPNNLIAPFVEGHTLQLVFIAVVAGAIILQLADRVRIITDVIEQSNVIVMATMDAVVKLMPIIVFISIFQMIADGNIEQAKRIAGAVVAIIILCLALLATVILVVSARHHTNPIRLVRAILPVALITLTTRSSASALSTHLNRAKTKVGIDPKIADFGIPLGHVLLRPGSVIVYLCYAYGLAVIYGIAINPQWIVVALIVSILMACAEPPVNGGAVAVLSILLGRLGIPAEALGIVLAAEVVVDFVATTTNVACVSPVVLAIADGLGMRDRNLP